ncbi:MAG: hypothetical protein GY799_11755, partial [Desulfobulbaceae bacterium]|nr:hypothetical protein [Desulfobulbaceae bacterium]
HHMAEYRRQFRPEVQAQGRGSYVAQETVESYVAQDTVSAHHSNSLQCKVTENTTQLLSEQAADREVLEETNVQVTNSLDEARKHRRELEQAKRNPVNGQEKTNETVGFGNRGLCASSEVDSSGSLYQERRMDHYSSVKSRGSFCASETGYYSASSSAEARIGLPRKLESEEDEYPSVTTDLHRGLCAATVEQFVSENKSPHHSMTLAMMKGKNFPVYEGASQPPKANKWPIMIPKHVLARYNPNVHGRMYRNFNKWFQEFLEAFQLAGGEYLNKSQWAIHLVYHLDDEIMRGEVMDYIREENVTQLEEVLDFMYRTLLDENDCAAVRAQLPNIIWHPESENLIHFKTRLREAYKESRKDHQLRPSDYEFLAESFLLALPYDIRKEIIQHFGAGSAALDDVEQLYPFASQVINRDKVLQRQEELRKEMKVDTYKTEGYRKTGWSNSG